jgi:hypothetical protein
MTPTELAHALHGVDGTLAPGAPPKALVRSA